MKCLFWVCVGIRIRIRLFIMKINFTHSSLQSIARKHQYLIQIYFKTKIIYVCFQTISVNYFERRKTSHLTPVSGNKSCHPSKLALAPLLSLTVSWTAQTAYMPDRNLPLISSSKSLRLSWRRCISKIISRHLRRKTKTVGIHVRILISSSFFQCLLRRWWAVLWSHSGYISLGFWVFFIIYEFCLWNENVSNFYSSIYTEHNVF